jgi:hypothetical protein
LRGRNGGQREYVRIDRVFEQVAKFDCWRLAGERRDLSRALGHSTSVQLRSDRRRQRDIARELGQYPAGSTTNGRLPDVVYTQES